ncbi:MAG: flagellar biosynthetic protein FliR [Planctomycetota bacterium]|jgi:flagellar biosynthetic protein FliR
MPYGLLDILLALPVFALVLFRMGGLMLTAPLFSSSVIPLRIRAAFAMVISLMMVPVVSRHAPADLSLFEIVTASVSEVTIGATIGVALTLVLLGADIAGMLVGQQGGLALGQIFDPMLNRQTTVTGQVYTVVFTLVFLGIGGHRATLAALLDTYEAIPMMTFAYDESIVMLFVEILGAAFILAIRLAGPVVIALLLVGTAMGFLSRTMPQFNILSVGFTIRAMLTLAVAGLTLTACRELMIEAIWNGITMTRTVLGLAT